MGDKYKQLQQHLGVIRDLQDTAAVLSWDQETVMPEGGLEARARQMGTLSAPLTARLTDLVGGAVRDELLGLPVSDDDGSSCALKIGADSFLIPRKTRKADGSAFIDHMCYTIEDWDRKAVEDELRARGFDPKADTDESFHIKDPDGFGLQISSSKLMYVP